MDAESTQKAVFVDEKTQKELNTPLVDPSGLTTEENAFFDTVMSLIANGTINLLDPETLINHEVYNGLSEEVQGKTDLEAMNLLASLREMKSLNDGGFKETFQMKNLVERVKNTKERLEAQGGNLFII